MGILLTAFGAYWAGEGVGLAWPGQDLSILGLVVFFTLSAIMLITLLRRRTEYRVVADEAVAGK